MAGQFDLAQEAITSQGICVRESENPSIVIPSTVSSKTNHFLTLSFSVFVGAVDTLQHN